MNEPNDTNMGVGQYQNTPEEKEIEHLNQQLKEARRQYVAETIELKGWERWATEVLTDFKIPFDAHPFGMRSAIVGWMAERLWRPPPLFKTSDVSDEVVENIELSVGMGYEGWDTVFPKEIIAAAWNHLPANPKKSSK